MFLDLIGVHLFVVAAVVGDDVATSVVVDGGDLLKSSVIRLQCPEIETKPNFLERRLSIIKDVTQF